MSVAAAIRITSPNEAWLIEHASTVAQQHGETCYVIAVVPELPYGSVAEGDIENVRRNLELIAEAQAVPIVQESDDVARALLVVASGFGARTLFLQNGSTAKKLRHLDPPFDVVVVGSK
jgi:K+-sensing histidine kinase KdpD